VETRQDKQNCCLRIHSANRRSQPGAAARRHQPGRELAPLRALSPPPLSPRHPLQAGAAPAWGAATNLDQHQASEDPTSVSCPSAELLHGCARIGLRGQLRRKPRGAQPTRLSSSGGEPDSVSLPDRPLRHGRGRPGLIRLSVHGSRWSSGGTVPITQTGHGIGIVLVTELLCRRQQRLRRCHFNVTRNGKRKGSVGGAPPRTILIPVHTHH